MSGRSAALALGMLALSAAAASAQGRPFAEPQAARYGWLPGLEEGKAQARKAGKPLMVVIRCVP
jgi:ABC-type sugar transport system substrate-binding protein